MQLEQYRLDRLPEIIVADDEAGREDRQHPHPPGHRLRRLDARRAAPAAAATPARPPVTQVMDSILGMALQLPALKSIGESIGVDLSAAVGPSRSGARPGSGAPRFRRATRPRADKR